MFGIHRTGAGVSNSVAKAQKKETKKALLMQQDGILSRAEKKELRKDDGVNLSRSEIRKYSLMEGGEEFLDAYINVKGSTPDEIMMNRKTLAMRYFIGEDNSNLDDIAPEIRKDLNRFGVSDDEISAYLELTRLNARRPKGTITGDVKAGDNSQISARIEPYTDKEGQITSLNIYEGDAMNSENSEPTGRLTLQDGYFVNSNGDKFYQYNEENNVLTDVTTQVNEEKAKAEAEAPAKSETEAEEKAIAKAETEAKAKVAATKAAFQTQKQVNIDETGSGQRLTAKEKWATGFVIPKNTEFNENGLPNKIAIELPSDYGSENADGVKQKRYQTLKYDSKTGRYSDSANIRQFEAEIDETGNITLKQVNIDDKNVKSFLDNNTTIAQDQARKAGLTEDMSKMEISAQKESEQLMAQLSDRNTSWETYTQVGTDVGRITGSHGLLEKLVDESDVTGLKTYNDLKPAIDGLMARVPEKFVDTPEYKAVQAAIEQLAADPNADIKSKWFNQLLGDTPIRKLDRALMKLAQTHLAGDIQGANQANNSYLVGGEGKVTIAPDREKGIWNTDAKFTIGGQDYYLYQQRALIDRTVDFQDAVEYKDDGKLDELSLIRNEITGNNRHGEIKFDAKRAETENFYFKGASGKKMPVIVENDIAYVQLGDIKIPVEDILNGRASMPDMTS